MGVKGYRQIIFIINIKQWNVSMLSKRKKITAKNSKKIFARKTAKTVMALAA